MTRRRAPAPAAPAVERCRADLAEALLAEPENGHLRAMLDDPAELCALHAALLRASHRLCFLALCAQAGLAPPAELGAGRGAAPDRGAGAWPALLEALAALGAPDEAAGDLAALRGARLGADPLARLWAALQARLAAEDPTTALCAAYEDQLAREPVAAGGRLALRPADDSARSRQGSFYTPPGLVAATLDLLAEPAGAEGGPLRAVDPACGAGHFLLALAERLGGPLGPEARGELVEHTLHGVDLDPIAAELCRLRLYLWAGRSGAALAPLHRQIAVGDALLGWSLSPPEGAAPTAGPATTQQADRWCAAFFSGAPRGAAPAGLTDAALDAISAQRRFFHWGLRFPAAARAGGFDLLIGNPPFQSPLAARGALGPEAARLVDATLPGRRTATTDLATLFLARGAQLLRPGGRLGLVLPLATLSASGAAPTRAALAQAGGLTGLGMTEQRSFAEANVRVCLLSYQRGGPRRLALRRSVGPDFRPAPPLPIDMDALGLAAEGWGPLVAALAGAPATHVESDGHIADLAEATGDFRDQFYGLAPFIREAGPEEGPGPDRPRLIITGLIDPAEDLWGRRPCRFAGQRFARPLVALPALLADPTLGAWARARLRPKLMVATQSKVIEAAADPEGSALNTVPTLTVTPKRPEDLWRLLAVLLAPPLSALAWSQTFGAALSAQAIKLSASQLLRLPLPAHPGPWAAGAAAAREAQEASGPEARRAALLRCGAAMCAAYGLPAEPTLGWWAARLPR